MGILEILRRRGWQGLDSPKHVWDNEKRMRRDKGPLSQMKRVAGKKEWFNSVKGFAEIK